ncbi:MAG: hypothetical protein Q4C22_07800, partial [Bacillota bacterium]|nr:hypothetical protein [Bacillota bacterium]
MSGTMTKKSNELETMFLFQEVERCEDTEDVREILRRYDSSFLSWQREINRLVDESGCSYQKLGERCGISKNTIKSWCLRGGAPRCRNTYLKLAFGLEMSAKEADRLLVRYGGYPGLYARDLFDAVCIFLLDRQVRRRERVSYEDARALFARCNGQSRAADENLDTVTVAETIRKIEDEEEFIAFVESHKDAFCRGRSALSKYLRTYVEARSRELGGTGESTSLHGYFSASGIPSRYEKIFSNLSLYGVIPRREQLMALGLFLEMTPEELNRTLVLAGMEPLCAKNRLECVLIYALQQLCLLHPELPLSNAMLLLAATEDPALAEECRRIVAEYTERTYRCDHRDLETVADYVRQLFRELDLEQSEEL